MYVFIDQLSSTLRVLQLERPLRRSWKRASVKIFSKNKNEILVWSCTESFLQ